MNQLDKWIHNIKTNSKNEYDYLYNQKLLNCLFVARNTNDHMHCELCWDRFSELPHDLHKGYVTTDCKYWVCPQCYDLFCETFHWSVIEDS